MKELHWLNKLSENSQDNAVIMLWWCWTEWKPHQNIISFLENQNLEVYHLCRDWDKLLWKERAIEKYLEDIRNAILSLISEWKKVHLWWNSFGWYLALKIWEEISNNVSSIVTIAPVLNPKEALNRCKSWQESDRIIINLPNWKKLHILNSNIENLSPPKLILPNCLIAIWSKDWLTDTYELDKINWENLIKYIIEWAQHWNTTSNQKTIEINRKFYSNIISN